jgi:hypothetical protein
MPNHARRNRGITTEIIEWHRLQQAASKAKRCIQQRELRLQGPAQHRVLEAAGVFDWVGNLLSPLMVLGWNTRKHWLRNRHPVP